MAEDSGDTMLVKIAVFGVTMSIICTAMIGLLFATSGTGDYDFDSIQAYRDDLVSFSGESMLTQTPWVLTEVYTPWDPSTGAEGHVTEDGWLYGQSVDYAYLGQAANIRLDPDQKSAVPLSYTLSEASYTVTTGFQWWVGGSLVGLITIPIAEAIGVDPYARETVTGNNWSYTGYRYCFDPTLPFQYDEGGNPKTAVADGKLSLVWYSFNGQEGLSGGLDVYNGSILLASYSATDIIANYRSSDFATTYNFDFDGAVLTLSIKFDPETLSGGSTLMQAWTSGNWSMAISSVSAGNFFDLENSASFTTSAGGMINTFIQVYTLSLPSVQNPWMDMILWMLVGLPMTIALLCVTLRLVNGFRIL